uniref:Protein kinase domain-containing protein n=1 Tax=Chromera velia CCMP2878 TaxID=1169474 RepID=A0A0G4I9H8_9ALVE|eukprot:Cvel_12278.t1-p1 / transcript=Cvel_12278.t1 / gene=Cvel_12278 / organism=Chromera_velia_CCMP2878 / gene_product=hypothetical protein / transcript_product=hypothetical protein / location=Cvel_scaffold796:36640-50563(-) / protein_length=1673 / sequence_SO=supercontig / SO=protein_coding / is_pseudo=false
MYLEWVPHTLRQLLDIIPPPSSSSSIVSAPASRGATVPTGRGQTGGPSSSSFSAPPPPPAAESDGDNMVPLSALSEQDRKDISVQLLSAQLHLHRESIIHRSLKPENVLLARDAQSGKVISKLIDFGLARNLVGNEGNDSPNGEEDSGSGNGGRGKGEEERDEGERGEVRRGGGALPLNLERLRISEMEGSLQKQRWHSSPSTWKRRPQRSALAALFDSWYSQQVDVPEGGAEAEEPFVLGRLVKDLPDEGCETEFQILSKRDVDLSVESRKFDKVSCLHPLMDLGKGGALFNVQLHRSPTKAPNGLNTTDDDSAPADPRLTPQRFPSSYEPRSLDDAACICKVFRAFLPEGFEPPLSISCVPITDRWRFVDTRYAVTKGWSASQKFKSTVRDHKKQMRATTLAAQASKNPFASALDAEAQRKAEAEALNEKYKFLTLKKDAKEQQRLFLIRSPELQRRFHDLAVKVANFVQMRTHTAVQRLHLEVLLAADGSMKLSFCHLCELSKLPAPRGRTQVTSPYVKESLSACPHPDLREAMRPEKNKRIFQPSNWFLWRSKRADPMERHRDAPAPTTAGDLELQGGEKEPLCVGKYCGVKAEVETLSERDMLHSSPGNFASCQNATSDGRPPKRKIKVRWDRNKEATKCRGFHHKPFIAVRTGRLVGLPARFCLECAHHKDAMGRLAQQTADQQKQQTDGGGDKGGAESESEGEGGDKRKKKKTQVDLSSRVGVVEVKGLYDALFDCKRRGDKGISRTNAIEPLLRRVRLCARCWALVERVRLARAKVLELQLYREGIDINKATATCLAASSTKLQPPPEGYTPANRPVFGLDATTAGGLTGAILRAKLGMRDDNGLLMISESDWSAADVTKRRESLIATQQTNLAPQPTKTVDVATAIRDGIPIQKSGRVIDKANFDLENLLAEAHQVKRLREEAELMQYPVISEEFRRDPPNQTTDEEIKGVKWGRRESDICSVDEEPTVLPMNVKSKKDEGFLRYSRVHDSCKIPSELLRGNLTEEEEKMQQRKRRETLILKVCTATQNDHQTSPVLLKWKRIRRRLLKLQTLIRRWRVSGMSHKTKRDVERERTFDEQNVRPDTSCWKLSALPEIKLASTSTRNPVRLALDAEDNKAEEKKKKAPAVVLPERLKELAAPTNCRVMGRANKASKMKRDAIRLLDLHAPARAGAASFEPALPGKESPSLRKPKINPVNSSSQGNQTVIAFPSGLTEIAVQEDEAPLGGHPVNTSSGGSGKSLDSQVHTFWWERGGEDAPLAGNPLDYLRPFTADNLKDRWRVVRQRVDKITRSLQPALFPDDSVPLDTMGTPQFRSSFAMSAAEADRVAVLWKKRVKLSRLADGERRTREKENERDMIANVMRKVKKSFETAELVHDGGIYKDAIENILEEAGIPHDVLWAMTDSLREIKRDPVPIEEGMALLAVGVSAWQALVFGSQCEGRERRRQEALNKIGGSKNIFHDVAPATSVVTPLAAEDMEQSPSKSERGGHTPAGSRSARSGASPTLQGSRGGMSVRSGMFNVGAASPIAALAASQTRPRTSAAAITGDATRAVMAHFSAAYEERASGGDGSNPGRLDRRASEAYFRRRFVTDNLLAQSHPGSELLSRGSLAREKAAQAALEREEMLKRIQSMDDDSFRRRIGEEIGVERPKQVRPRGRMSIFHTL